MKVMLLQDLKILISREFIAIEAVTPEKYRLIVNLNIIIPPLYMDIKNEKLLVLIIFLIFLWEWEHQVIVMEFQVIIVILNGVIRIGWKGVLNDMYYFYSYNPIINYFFDKKGLHLLKQPTGNIGITY